MLQPSSIKAQHTFSNNQHTAQHLHKKTPKKGTARYSTKPNIMCTQQLYCIGKRGPLQWQVHNSACSLFYRHKRYSPIASARHSAVASKKHQRLPLQKPAIHSNAYSLSCKHIRHSPKQPPYSTVPLRKQAPKRYSNSAFTKTNTKQGTAIIRVHQQHHAYCTCECTALGCWADRSRSQGTPAERPDLCPTHQWRSVLATCYICQKARCMQYGHEHIQDIKVDISILNTILRAFINIESESIS